MSEESRIDAAPEVPAALLGPNTLRPLEPLADPRPPQTDEKHAGIPGQLAVDFVLFTPALILTHGRFDRDPVVEFIRHFPAEADEQPQILDSVIPLFASLPRMQLGGELVDWNHRLYIVPRHRWDLCRVFLGSLTMYDPNRYHYARVMHYDLTMLLPEEQAPQTVVVFGVATNQGQFYLAPLFPGGLPEPQRQPAPAHILAEAQVVLGPPPDPAGLTGRASLLS